MIKLLTIGFIQIFYIDRSHCLLYTVLLVFLTRWRSINFTRDILGKCVRGTHACYMRGGGRSWQKSLHFHYLESKCVTREGDGRQFGKTENLVRYWPYLKANPRGRCTPDRMHGRVCLTEVRCTRIRLAPFCIRLSKKPCGGYLVRIVGRQSWNTRVMESSANGNACLFAQRMYF